MADVSLRGVIKRFDQVEVLKGVDLDITDGEFMVFVGPSGCGKSTLLRTIAGLEDATGGQIAIGGRAVEGLSPSDRGIAMVFQSYALYPHMNVYENMAFGLKLAKADKAEIDRRVRGAAETLNIVDYLDRKPKALSGGQRQRVAIGRAIVREPEVFLFDEPLSNLDAALRVRMRYEFADLHRRLGATMIYVTHDQVEAMTLADRIAVLNGGRIEQVGSPMTLYDHPETLFVAEFIGSPRMNLATGRVLSAGPNGVQVRLDAGPVLALRVDGSGATEGDAVTVGVRPEHLIQGGEDNLLEVVTTFVETLGHANQVYGRLEGGDTSITLLMAGDARIVAGQTLTVAAPANQLHLFDASGRAFRRLDVPGAPDQAEAA